MTIQRISTFAMHQGTLKDVNIKQSSLFNMQKQLSSGFKAEYFKELPRQVEQFTQLEAKILRTGNYIRGNEVVLARLNTTQVTLDKTIDIADSVEDLMTLRRSANGNEIGFVQQLENFRESAAKMLNTTFEGRYIFGGTNTSVPPVKDNPFPTAPQPGVPSDHYYQGSKENVTVRAQENFEIAYNVRADDPAFQKFFAAIDKAIQGHNNPVLTERDGEIAAAIDMLQEGMAEMTAAQTRVNANIVALENINERHTELKLYWQGISESIIKTDIVSVSTQAAVDQAVLQATFQTFARINQLRLSDYLK